MNRGSSFYHEALSCIDQAMLRRPDIVMFIGGDIPRDYDRQSDLIRVGKACRARGQDYMWASAKEHIPRAFETFNKPGTKYITVDLHEMAVGPIETI